MAIVFDKRVAELYQSFSNQTTFSFSVIGAVPAGNLIAVGMFLSRTDFSIVSISDARGNTYNLSSSAINNNNVQQHIHSRMAYSILTTALQIGDLITITFSGEVGSLTTCYGILVSYSGIAAVPLDQQGTALDDAFPQTQPVGPSLTTTQADELLVSFFASANTKLFTPTTNWTKRDTAPGTQPIGLLYEDRIVSSIGTYAAAPSIPSDDYWNAHTMTFKGASAELDSVLPDADITTTGWTTTPLYSKINDDSDATVIQATAS